jgi:hypothetical protein
VTSTAPPPSARSAPRASSASAASGFHHADRTRRGRRAIRGLLVAAWTGWSVFAGVIFVMTCGVVACHTGASGLIVCPPLAFFAGSMLAQALTALDTFSAAVGILVTLASSASWLFTGAAVTVAIALGRGWRPRMPRGRCPAACAPRAPSGWRGGGNRRRHSQFLDVGGVRVRDDRI